MEYRFTPILFLLIFCCSSDEQIVENLNYNTIVNLHAPANGGQGENTDGNFTKFDFESGMQTMSESEWDIAFRTTTIIVNGGYDLNPTLIKIDKKHRLKSIKFN